MNILIISFLYIASNLFSYHLGFTNALRLATKIVREEVKKLDENHHA